MKPLRFLLRCAVVVATFALAPGPAKGDAGLPGQKFRSSSAKSSRAEQVEAQQLENDRSFDQAYWQAILAFTAIAATPLAGFFLIRWSRAGQGPKATLAARQTAPKQR